MPIRVDRTFRPIRRTLRIAITVSVVFAVVGYGSGQTLAHSLFVFVAVFALALGMCSLLYREDIAALVRARREG